MRDGIGEDFLRALKDACKQTSGARLIGIPLDSMAITAARTLGATDRGSFLSLPLGP